MTYYKISTISQVAGKYIHFNDNGKQDKKVSDKKALEVARGEIKKELLIISRIEERCNKKANDINERLSIAKNRIESLERYIKDHQHLPIVRRGLSEQHSSLRYANEKYTTISNQLGGVHEILTDCDNERIKLLNLIQQIDAVLRNK